MTLIAIDNVNSGTFLNEWIKFLKREKIHYKEVDCLSNDIVYSLKDCNALLWHWPHHDFRAQMCARQIIASVEQMGIAVYPSTSTCWHYDDKIGQKYLLEALGAPLIKTYIFFEKSTAIQWAETADFPKVWKLRNGAGSQNVRLVHSKKEALRLIKRCFGNGWTFSRFYGFKEGLRKYRRDRTLEGFLKICNGLGRAIFPHVKYRRLPLQRHYAYFQDFASGNICDIRVVVIGNRAVAIKRFVRDGDFRASGSGAIEYDPREIPLECVRIAFNVSECLKSQSCAFDFVSMDGTWEIVEISYAFSASAYKKCPGFWDKSLNWRDGDVNLETFILMDLLASL